MHQLSAPSTTDVEYPLRAGRARLFGVVVEFAALRALKIVIGAFPYRARIRHRRVEPDPPEFVADVVVMTNRGRARTQIRLAQSEPFLLRTGGLRSLASSPTQ